MKFGEIWVNPFWFWRDANQCFGQANSVIYILNIRKTKVCQVSIDPMFFEFEINGQATKNIKTSAHPSDEEVFARCKLIKDRQIQVHFDFLTCFRVYLYTPSTLPQPYQCAPSCQQPNAPRLFRSSLHLRQRQSRPALHVTTYVRAECLRWRGHAGLPCFV